MKKIRDFFASILVIFLLASVFSANTRKKRSIWKYLVIPVLCVILLYEISGTIYTFVNGSNDCVPQTLQRIFPGHSLKELKALCDTKSDGTTFRGLTNAWHKLSTNELIVTYSTLTNIPDTSEKEHISMVNPYIWIGQFQGGGHCALIKFTPTNVLFSHSEYYPGTTNYYNTEMEYTNFFKRTYLIFKAKELNETIKM